MVKKHKHPRFGPEVDEATELFPDSSNSDSELPPSAKSGWFAKMERKIKNTFFLIVDNHHREWCAHHDSKAIRSNQKKIMRALNIPVVSGSEDRITPYEKWRSAHSKWEDIEDDVESSRHPDPEDATEE